MIGIKAQRIRNTPPALTTSRSSEKRTTRARRFGASPAPAVSNQRLIQRVIQLADGDRFNNGDLNVRERHGGSGNRRTIGLVTPGGDYATLRYSFDGDDDELVYLEHIDALNFPGGTGISYLLLHQFAEQMERDGKTEVKLGTAVFEKEGNPPDVQAAVHVYSELGYDTSSAAAVMGSSRSVSDILRITGGKIESKGWRPGELGETAPLLGNQPSSSKLCPGCVIL